MRNDLLPAVLEACARSAAWRATLQLLGSDRTSEVTVQGFRKNMPGISKLAVETRGGHSMLHP